MKKTIYQKLTDVIIGAGNNGVMPAKRIISNYNISPTSTIIQRFDNKEDRDTKLAQLRQERLLAHQWAKSGHETSIEQLAGANQVKVMYRDADLMDAWPEIGAGLDTISEEATTINNKGKMLNIYSKSERIQSTLEDLFVNRLSCHVMLPMIVRATCKYGNEFMHLNIDSNNGVMGWRELPVHEMRRIENGMINAYSGSLAYATTSTNLKDGEVKFVWEGHNETMPYKNWQIAHFRLIKDSLLLPYGVSWLNKARRHWRMLSMMEDAMLLYRLERSIERRMFKVNVGLIDDADVPVFLQEFANNFKRAPIIDPQTGQIDLRKNFLDVSADYFIPVRSGQDPTTIENLPAAQNPTTMDDIKYMETKVMTALRLPKNLNNFEESQGKSNNLSDDDIRFCRVVNSVQQAVLLELNKIAIIHLALLGFTDDLTNFTISLNNPSNALEGLQLDNLQKRLGAASTALQEQGGGIPLMSWHQVQKEIMGKTDKEIADILNEIRLEFAIAAEIQQTSQIIKKTGMFDKVDRIYGEPGAKYSQQPAQEQDGGMGGGLGGGGMMGGPDIGGGDFGDGLGDLGQPGADDGGAPIGGEEGAITDMGDIGGGPNNENIHKTDGRDIITEKYFNKYINMLIESENEETKVNGLSTKAISLNSALSESLEGIDDLKTTKLFD